jgi:hypothetical protein
MHGEKCGAGASSKWICFHRSAWESPKWRHQSGRQVIVAMHGNKPIPIGTLKSIIEGSGLSVDDFR